jgi:hypothetical protein
MGQDQSQNLCITLNLQELFIHDFVAAAGSWHGAVFCTSTFLCIVASEFIDCPGPGNNEDLGHFVYFSAFEAKQQNVAIASTLFNNHGLQADTSSCLYLKSPDNSAVSHFSITDSTLYWRLDGSTKATGIGWWGKNVIALSRNLRVQFFGTRATNRFTFFGILCPVIEISHYVSGMSNSGIGIGIEGRSEKLTIRKSSFSSLEIGIRVESSATTSETLITDCTFSGQSGHGTEMADYHKGVIVRISDSSFSGGGGYPYIEFKAACPSIIANVCFNTDRRDIVVKDACTLMGTILFARNEAYPIVFQCFIPFMIDDFLYENS